jgi:hypothetical protein
VKALPQQITARRRAPTCRKPEDQPQPVRVRRAHWTVVTLRYLVPPYME